MNPWVSFALQVVTFALSQHPKTAKISNEVATGVVEAEQIFGKGNGPEKLQHAVNVALTAAQAADELKGGPDEVEGPVRAIVSATIPLVNALAKHVG